MKLIAALVVVACFSVVSTLFVYVVRTISSLLLNTTACKRLRVETDPFKISVVCAFMKTVDGSTKPGATVNLTS